jgi:hypothetical protein
MRLDDRAWRRQVDYQGVEVTVASNGTYEDSNGEPMLRESIVLYVDELGTTEALANLTDADLGQVTKDHVELGWFLHSSDAESFQRSVRFSDNTVVGAPVTDSDDGGAFHQIFSAATYQCNLVMRGRFLRGGIARGPLYIADSYVTGAGLVMAVKLEELTAVFPRVVIERRLIEGILRETMPEADPFDSPANRFVLVDADGELFVNYLAALAEDEEDIAGWLRTHRDVIEQNLALHGKNERVRRKYAWVAQYHNWACSERFFNLPDLEVRTGMDFIEGAYPRQISLLIPRPGILDGTPGRPPKKPSD